MSEQAIGVFDSGLGGLTAVKELTKVLPQENIIYFGDTARVPYGSRSDETIKKYARQDAAFLLSKKVKLIIAACGTVSSVATELKDELPVPFTGVVLPTAAAAVSSTRNGKIGIIGTSATVKSCSYKNEILRQNSELTVFQQDCPLFVNLVENGFISEDDCIVQLVVERYLSQMKKDGIDTLIDSGKETALYAAHLLSSNELLNTSNHAGACSYYVSDTVESFMHTAEIFLGQSVEKVKHINIEQAALQ